jgi:adenylate cyclase
VQRAHIRSAFGQYLAPSLVEQLAQSPDKLVLGGEERDMTILFSDVRGFTAISEVYKDDPQGLTSLMNRLLTPLTNTIIDHDGTVDCDPELFHDNSAAYCPNRTFVGATIRQNTLET